MAYGFQQLDSSGNVIVDSSAPVQTIAQIATGLSITLYPSNVGANTYDWNGCTGVSSQADLEDNYVFNRTDAGAWNLFTSENNHTITYISTNTVRFTWAGSCRNFWGNAVTCTTYHAVGNTFDVYAIGKTL